MWSKLWNYKEGAAVGAGLLLTGTLLQLFVGEINWDYLVWPTNIITTGAFIIILLGLHMLRGRVYLCRWLGLTTSAVCALMYALLMTVIMGLVRQAPSGTQAIDPIGFSQMIRSWPFVLIYTWLTVSLGLTVLRRGFPSEWRDVVFQLNHAGLFISLVAATMGNADMQRLKMTCRLGNAEWRAVDSADNIHELPLAIELQEFTIEEYPPKLMIISNATGKTLPEGNPHHMLLEDGVKRGSLLDWDIQIVKNIPMAASVATRDTIIFTEFHSMGATFATYLKARHRQSGISREGWVSNGSFMFPYKALQLDSEHSIVMPEREPRRYASRIKAYTESSKVLDSIVEVNHPVGIEGWKIYQLSYDESKGRWSDISIFELVRDPWLPAVYVGIFMMMAGALAMMFTKSKPTKQL